MEASHRQLSTTAGTSSGAEYDGDIVEFVEEYMGAILEASGINL